MSLRLCFTTLLMCVPIALSAQTSPPAVKVEASTPQHEISLTLEEILKVLESPEAKENAATRRAKLREVINPRFDFAEMAQRCLGPHWQGRTPEEQRDFVAVFSDLLAKTYLAKIELVQRDTVKIDRERVDHPPYGEVKTTITYKGDKFPLDYKLINKEGRWKVYDVVIEGIGLVTTYRNEFAGIIRKESFQGLMTQLRAKNARTL